MVIFEDLTDPFTSNWLSIGSNRTEMLVAHGLSNTEEIQVLLKCGTKEVPAVDRDGAIVKLTASKPTALLAGMANYKYVKPETILPATLSIGD